MKWLSNNPAVDWSYNDMTKFNKDIVILIQTYANHKKAQPLINKSSNGTKCPVWRPVERISGFSMGNSINVCVFSEWFWLVVVQKNFLQISIFCSYFLPVCFLSAMVCVWANRTYPKLKESVTISLCCSRLWVLLFYDRVEIWLVEFPWF